MITIKANKQKAGNSVGKSIKLIALDMDGTILDDNGNFSNKTALKLKELTHKGIQVVFATGRTHRSAENVMNKMGISLPIISHNGSKAVVPLVGELYNNKMPLEDAKVILSHGDKNNLYSKAYIDNVLYIKEPDEVSLQFAKDHGIDYKVVGNLGENIPSGVNMIIFIYPEAVDEDYSEIFKTLNISITRSMPQAYEFMAEGCHKGKALKIVADYLGIKKEEILAVGNALNDLEMLKFAGTGIAMKNSDTNLLEVWDDISSFTNNEEGVYEMIKEL